MTLGDTNLLNNRPPPAELSFRFSGVFGSRGWQRETIELFVFPTLLPCFSKSNIKGTRLSPRRRVRVACQIRLGCHTQVDASAAIPRVADGNALECKDEMVT